MGLSWSGTAPGANREQLHEVSSVDPGFSRAQGLGVPPEAYRRPRVEAALLREAKVSDFRRQIAALRPEFAARANRRCVYLASAGVKTVDSAAEFEAKDPYHKRYEMERMRVRKVDRRPRRRRASSGIRTERNRARHEFEYPASRRPRAVPHGTRRPWQLQHETSPTTYDTADASTASR